jgi:antitoxin MazE
MFKHSKETAMTQVMLDIKKWGNSLGVRLPAAIAEMAHLRVDQRVRIEVVDGLITITPVLDVPLTLEQRLANYDAARYDGEVMLPTERLGAEKW